MKLIQLSGCKMLLAVIVILLVSLIYYHSLFKSFGQRLNRIESTQNLSTDTGNEVTTSKRIKRFLIFQGGGVVKLVFGTSFPIVLADRKRSLNYFYNFQMQYTPPIIPLYWWSVFNTTTFVARTNLRKRSMDKLLQNDRSRVLIYEIIETILERSGNVNNNCLLKIICEVARAPLTEDLSTNNEDTEDNGETILDDYGKNIYHRLINTIFTPQKSDVDERYLNAQVAGQKGANCDETFGKCQIIEKLFQHFTQFI